MISNKNAADRTINEFEKMNCDTKYWKQIVHRNLHHKYLVENNKLHKLNFQLQKSSTIS